VVTGWKGLWGRYRLEVCRVAAYEISQFLWVLDRFEFSKSGQRIFAWEVLLDVFKK